MKNEDISLQELRLRVERFMGISITTKHDFDALAKEIFRHKKVQVSPTTLRRLWGYQEQDTYTASNATLDTLSRLVGFAGWKAFCEEHERERNSSEMMIERRSVLAEELELNTQLVVAWLPDRMVHLEFMGDDTFRVAKSENSKLQAGDTFCCRQLTEGMSLYCENLQRKGCAPMNYVGGKDGGITFHLLNDERDEQ